MSNVQKHFDDIANTYDFWKKKNAYYYLNVKKIYRNFIPPEKKILDVGCGTGDILAFLKPKYGVGIDISSKLIGIAKEKHKKLKSLYFSTSTIKNLKIKDFDFIILSDVVEHLENVEEMIFDISSIVNNKTTLIITMANPNWEPILEIAEKLKLKMPEGVHKRISDRDLIAILMGNDFKIVSFGSRLIFPLNWGAFSNLVNEIYYKIPLIQNWGVIHFFVCRKV